MIKLDSETIIAHRFEMGQIRIIQNVKLNKGSKLKPGSSFALLGTIMSPGFDFGDYEVGCRADLLGKYPQYREWIDKLTQE
jgi:predicted cupin superfamily sugar epimerase